MVKADIDDAGPTTTVLNIDLDSSFDWDED
jgi:hypothetical protein